MNPIAIVHVIVGLLAIAVSVPLAKRKVKMNPWYGIRIPEAFKSEERWFEINHYGGRLMLWWAISIVIVATIGLLLPRNYWIIYSFSAAGIILAGLGLVVVCIFKYAAKTKRER
jgi:hypothetical protein